MYIDGTEIHLWVKLYTPRANDVLSIDKDEKKYDFQIPNIGDSHKKIECPDTDPGVLILVQMSEK